MTAACPAPISTRTVQDQPKEGKEEGEEEDRIETVEVEAFKKAQDELARLKATSEKARVEFEVLSIL